MAGEYERQELLGSGSYGKAWLVRDTKKNRQAVLKEIRLECLSEKEMSQALVEVKVLSKCRHVNIISYCEAFLNSGCLNIVMEYADGGDLQKRITEQKGLHFDREVILDWFIQICFALKYLHSENILHRDLKPQNLFLTSDGVVKVGDFGIARVLEDTADHALTAIGTPYYLSPEICQRKMYNSQSDMWSAGCVLYELCCLHVPFQAHNLPMLVLKILDGCYQPIPSEYGAVLEDLVSVLLKTDPSHRPSAEQVLNIPVLHDRVKATYRKCVRHRQERLRVRALSRGLASPCSQESEKSVSPNVSQHTYTVRRPLLRRLSVATPKAAASAKRQHRIHSSESPAAVKRQRKSSKPPVLGLHGAVQDLRPERQPRPPCCADPANSQPGGPEHRLEPASVDADVFEPETRQPQDKDSVGVRDNRRVKRQVEDRPPLVRKSSVRKERSPGQCVQYDGPRRCGEESSCVSSWSKDGKNRMKKVSGYGMSSDRSKDTKGDREAHRCLPEREMPPYSLDSCDIEAHGYKSDEKTPPHRLDCRETEVHRYKSDEKTLPHRLDCRETEVHRYKSDEKTPPHRLDGREVEAEGGRHGNGDPRVPSGTYTVDRGSSPGRERVCAVCREGGGSEGCVYQALLTSAALSARDRPSAQLSLSRFLAAHLGSEMTFHLCSLVHSALCHSPEGDFSTVAAKVDASLHKFLPAIFQLFILNNMED